MIPLMVDCTGRPVTIFGGGEVGARKARYFSDEADVTVYSRSFSPEFEDLRVRKVRTVLTMDSDQIGSCIRGAFLVIAATSDPGLNEAVLRKCQKEGILCNNATSPKGDVTLPAKWTGEEFTITVSTKGSSPAVARFIRERLESTLPEMDLMIRLEESFRQKLKDQAVPEQKRREILGNLLHDPVAWETLKEGIPAALRYAQERYPS